MKKRTLLTATASLLVAMAVQGVAAGPFPAVDGLVARRVPWLQGKVVFKQSASAADAFTLSSAQGLPVIEAGNALSAAVGLNWYLKYYCHRQMSHLGDNLSAPDSLPLVPKPERHVCSAPLRYALNYCTQNYTFSFYTWDDWQRELDWMALHGVNLMLVCTGEEAVWQNTLRRLGYSEKETADFIAGPAYTAWWLMGNLEGWGGPMPQTQIDARRELTRKILQRMRQFGMEPLMPGFFGMVPSAMKRHVRAQIVEQGLWCDMRRPDFLVPTDPQFARMAKVFYDETRRLYGANLRYFSGDPFHEGGSTEGIDVTAAGMAIQKAMLRAFPRATWVLQGWWGNPRPELIAQMDKKHLMVQELYGSYTADWETRAGYEGTPFLWCDIVNFGERPGFCGKLERMASEWHRVASSPYSRLLRGIGIMPEGIRNNPVAYELLLELPWHKTKVDVAAWLKDYACARYGRNDADVEAAWQVFLETIYASPNDGRHEGPCENVLMARPKLEYLKRVSGPGLTLKRYDVNLFRQGAYRLLQAAPRFAGSETFAADATQVRAQLVSNEADSVYDRMWRAFEAKDTAAFALQAGTMLLQLDYLDRLMGANPFFSLSTYIRQAERCGTTPQERRNNVHNLLMQVTYWGGGDPKTKKESTNEYAYKEWGGLIGSFYKPRWQAFFDYARRAMTGAGGEFPDYFSSDRAWVERAMQRYDAGGL